MMKSYVTKFPKNVENDLNIIIYILNKSNPKKDSVWGGESWWDEGGMEVCRVDGLRMVGV